MIKENENGRVIKVVSLDTLVCSSYCLKKSQGTIKLLIKRIRQRPPSQVVSKAKQRNLPGNGQRSWEVGGSGVGGREERRREGEGPELVVELLPATFIQSSSLLPAEILEFYVKIGL